MKEKSLNEKFIEYSKKKKLFKEEKKNLDIENIMSTAVKEGFKGEINVQLTDFGMLKKSSKTENGEKITNIEFFPDASVNERTGKKYLANRRRIAEEKRRVKMIIIISIVAVVLALAVLLGVGTCIYFKSMQHNRDASGDTIVSINKDVSNDIKEGQYKEETVLIDGKKYMKFSYVVKKGDCLWDISKVFLKNPFLWPTIQDKNKFIINPDLIYPNDQIIILKRQYD